MELTPTAVETAAPPASDKEAPSPSSKTASSPTLGRRSPAKSGSSTSLAPSPTRNKMAALTRSASGKPAQFALDLQHSNQQDRALAPSDASAVRPSSPVESASQLTTTTGVSFASPTVVAAEDIKEVLSDPESPAYAALVKANQEKSDASLLEKRPRIGNTKLGRIKYKDVNRSFKKPAGKEIHDQHEQYALTYGMMCGILNSAGLQNPFKQRLTMDDFMRVDKRIFPPNSKLQHPFKFKDYSPDIFRQIRRRFCIDSADYMVTLCGDFNYIEFMSNSKSGQFFFYSHDGRFMIKTQTKDESKFLRRILPHYYKFVMENPNTLITRFYGMHRVKMHHLRRKMHFIIMASVFDTPLEIHARFDLKGSTVGRRATPKERASHGVLKDMDLVDSGFRLQMGAERRAMLLVQLRKDVEFLKRMKIMDYSLLIGVHDARGQIQTKIYGEQQASPLPPQTSKSLPSSPISNLYNGVEPLANGELPVRLARSASVPEDGRHADGDVMPGAYTGASPGSPPYLAASSSAVDACFDQEFESGSDDSDSFESNLSDTGEFAADNGSGLPAHLQTHGSAILTPSSLPSMPSMSMASSLMAMEPISPRVLDVNRYPGHSESMFCKDEGGVYGRDRQGRKNGYTYFLGVIDILQQYNTRKIAETFFKGLRHNRKHISSREPDFYGDRFIEFMEQHVVLDDTLPVSSSIKGKGGGAGPRPASASSASNLHQL